MKLKASGEVLKDTINKAETLRDDLVFLSARGEASADRLENTIRLARNESGNTVVNENNPDRLSTTTVKNEKAKDFTGKTFLEREKTLQGGSTSNDEISEAERELLKALRSAG